MAIRHVVWDWNGTLHDDFPLILDAANVAMAAAGGDPIDEETYRVRFTRPIRAFYGELLGREVDDETWALLDRVFHDRYHEILDDEGGLTGDAPEALDDVDAVGQSQSILSMWHHDRLVPYVTGLGIADRFVRIDGLRGVGGGSKAPHLLAHLEALREAGIDVAADEVVMVGDTVDDAEAAEAAGVHIVLYTGGEHGPEALERTGRPVAHSLRDAVAVGRELSKGP
ncbi:MAG: HAD family hydrolase [Actinomycetota bacterium]